MNKKAFTLVELIGVIIVLGIIGLIAYPVVANTIRTTRTNAAKQGIDFFGKALEEAVTRYDLENGIALSGDFTTTDGYILNKVGSDDTTLKVNYNGKAVICDVIEVHIDKTVYLSNCSVDGNEISGYSYGTN